MAVELPEPTGPANCEWELKKNKMMNPIVKMVFNEFADWLNFIRHDLHKHELNLELNLSNVLFNITIELQKQFLILFCLHSNATPQFGQYVFEFFSISQTPLRESILCSFRQVS